MFSKIQSVSLLNIKVIKKYSIDSRNCK